MAFPTRPCRRARANVAAMPNRYVELLRLPGARGFASAAGLGRLPLSMANLGTVLLVHHATGSYGVAGAVGATLTIAYAACAPRVAALADRFGQREVLLTFVGVNAAGFLGLVLCTGLHAPRVLLFASAFVTGGSFPPLGSLTRARWTALLAGTGELGTAFALESAIDETIFTLGPMLATLLATAASPAAGLLVALVLAVTGTLAFAAQRESEPAVHERARAGGMRALRARGMPVLVVTFVAFGTVFGAVDVATVAFAREHGHPALAGPLLGLYAAASGVAGIAYGMRSWRAPLERRLRVALWLMALGIVPLPLVGGLLPMALAVLVAGVAISPSVIAGYGLIELLVPPSALTEGFAWLSTSSAAGAAIGLAAAGRIVDAADAHTAFLVSLAAALLSAVAVTLGRRRIVPAAAVAVPAP